MRYYVVIDYDYGLNGYGDSVLGCMMYFYYNENYVLEVLFPYRSISYKGDVEPELEKTGYLDLDPSKIIISPRGREPFVFEIINAEIMENKFDETYGIIVFEYREEVAKFMFQKLNDTKLRKLFFDSIF